MDYREAIIDCVEYLRDGYGEKGYSIFNNIDLLRKNLESGYFSAQKKENLFVMNDSVPVIIDHMIGSVISEIFGDLYMTGRYNFDVVDNALNQLIRRGVVSK